MLPNNLCTLQEPSAKLPSPAEPRKKPRKQKKPLSGWKFIAVTAACTGPFGVMLACLLSPILPTHQAALWEPIAFLVVGSIVIAAVEILWKTE